MPRVERTVCHNADHSTCINPNLPTAALQQHGRGAVFFVLNVRFQASNTTLAECTVPPCVRRTRRVRTSGPHPEPHNSPRVPPSAYVTSWNIRGARSALTPLQSSRTVPGGRMDKRRAVKHFSDYAHLQTG